MMPQRPLSVQSPFGDQAASESSDTKIGKVFLVGAGPGAPGLITLRGAECLAAADIVLYDGLANPKLLQLATHAELISVGKHGLGPLWTQNEINARLVELAGQGRQVVRLKGGDPAVFARTAEELEALASAGIPFEVVPGITAALAAASYVGIPITHRDHASAVAFITGQQQGDGAQELDWAALARFPGTLVFYMGVTTAGQWSQQLIAEGKDPSTPAAIVRRCSWADQRVIRCTLSDVAQQLTPASKLRPPVIVIIGPVSSLGQQFNWFDNLPLRGQGVWLTRPADQNQSLARRLTELGAEVFEQSAIDIQPPIDLAPLDQAVTRLAQGCYQAVAFTSRHGVDAVWNRLWQQGLDARAFGKTKIACVGDKTAERLTHYGLRADLVPTGDFNAGRLLATILEQGLAHGQSWFLPQAQQAADTLSSGLVAAGAEVERVIAYRSTAATQLSPELITALNSGAIGWVTITSPSIARAVYQLVSAEQRAHLKPLSFSEAISRELTALNWPAAAQATTTSEDALIDALCRVGRNKR
ncbi:MAG: uroporphyrinogen-III C-methyltransferase [Pirellulaceae bacterium]|nr:uroporphyrinogen-III C-methyltransferase [Pirellulaceae bacterium]